MKEITIKIDKQEVKDITDGLESRKLNLQDIKDNWNKAEREIEVINKLLKELKEEE